MRMALISLAVALIFGCSPDQDTNSLNTSPESDCAEVFGLNNMSSDFLLLSETHGTKESVEMFNAVICQNLKKEHRVLVALEYPETGNTGLSSFLESGGSKTDIEALFDSENYFWRKSNDGRSSVALLGVLEFLRNQSQAGANVQVWGFQPVEYDKKALEPRQAAYDFAMGKNLNSLSEIQNVDKVIGLIGSFHGKRTEGKIGPFSVKPAAMYVNDPNFKSLLLVHAGGRAWNCLGVENDEGKIVKDCRVREIGKSKWVEEFELTNQIKLGDYRKGFDGLYFVGEVSASEPANLGNTQ